MSFAIERFLHGLCEGAIARHLIDPHDRYSAVEFFVEYVRCNRNLYVKGAIARHLIDPHDRYSAAEFFVEYVRCNRNLRWCVI